MHSTSRHLNQAGVTALEMLLCLAVMMQMLLLNATFSQRKQDHWEQTLAAKHLYCVSTAAKYYVQDHIKALLENDDGLNTPQELSIAELQKENYLAPNFINQNAFQQITKIQLRCLTAENAEGNSMPNAPKLIQVLTYTIDGQAMSDAQARACADELDGGGYLPMHPDSQKEGENDAPPKILLGNSKAWVLDVSSIQDLQPGHIARLLYLSSAGDSNTRSGSKSATEDFLQRIQSAGANRYKVMETKLGIQDGASIQFLKSGESEVANIEDEEATSIRAHHFRLNKQAYWDEKVLQLSDQISFKENKLIFSDEESAKKLEIGAEGIVLTTPKSKSEITVGSFALQNEQYGFELLPNRLKMSDLTNKNTNSLSLELNETAGPQVQLQGNNPALNASLCLLELKFKNETPCVNLQMASSGFFTVELGAEIYGLCCCNSDGSVMGALSEASEITYSVSRICKPGLNYFHRLETTAKAQWP